MNILFQLKASAPNIPFYFNRFLSLCNGETQLAMFPLGVKAQPVVRLVITIFLWYVAHSRMNDFVCFAFVMCLVSATYRTHRSSHKKVKGDLKMAGIDQRGMVSQITIVNTWFHMFIVF